MKRWTRRVRAAFGMGFAWAFAGAIVGGIFEAIDNILPGALPFISKVDMWPQTLAIPFFIGGVLFSVVLAIAARNRRFGELSLPRFAALGSVAGLLLSARAVSLGAPVFFIGIATVGSALLASGSLALARVAERRDLLNTGGHAGELSEHTD